MADINNVIDTDRLGLALSQITPEWLGLGNVNNTPDSAKYVAYASSAGMANALKNNLVIRLKGGRTEGTDQFTFDGATAKSVNITAAKVGAVAVSQGTTNAGKLLYVNSAGEVTPIDLATLKTLLDALG